MWVLAETNCALTRNVNANGATTDVGLGALPTGFHTYKVQPTAAGFDFYVDGESHLAFKRSVIDFHRK